MNRLILSAGAALALLAPTAAGAADLELKAARTDQAITLDGELEAAWQKAKPLTLALDELTYKPSTGYDGMKKTDVEIRALYDADYLYVALRYKDPTQSLARWPWVKQGDGSWKQLSNKDSTGNENHYYEDKVSIAWNISEKGFAKKGCEQSCHMADKGKIDGIDDKSAGRHFTAGPGELNDVWHWKSVRTNSVGQTDDQIFNWFKNDQNPEWGRNSDSKTGGGYKDNINEAKTAPAFMNGKAGSKDVYWIRDEDKVPFVDNFKPGDIVAGVVVSPYQGGRADVPSLGVWKDGVWTLEIKRKLVTTGDKAREEDVQFEDLKKPYAFAVSVFDNTQINHLYHKKAAFLIFE